MLQQRYTERTQIMTISISLQGTCKILNTPWLWSVQDKTHTLSPDQTEWQYNWTESDITGWNTIRFVHSEHPDDLTEVNADGSLKNASHVNICKLYINNYLMPFDLLHRSAMHFIGVDNKSMWHHELGAPFVGQIKYYLPLEHWPFASTDFDNKSLWTHL